MKPTAAYAARTRVSEAKSRADIEEELRRHACDQIAVMTEAAGVWFAFTKNKRMFRMGITLPIDNQQERRRRLRTLYLYVKARLNAVRDGVKSFEAEFAQETVMGDGRTLAEHTLPQLQQIEASGAAPQRLMLPGGVA